MLETSPASVLILPTDPEYFLAQARGMLDPERVAVVNVKRVERSADLMFDRAVFGPKPNPWKQ